MEIVLVDKSKDSIEVLLNEEEGEVLLEPLKEKLLRDETVDLATYDSDHPIYGRKRLFVRVKSGKPQNAIKRALKEISGDYSSLLKLVDKVEPSE